MPKKEEVIVVDAINIPHEIEGWCHENEVSIHGEHWFGRIEANTPFGEWLKSEGFEPKIPPWLTKIRKYDEKDLEFIVAIWAT